MEATFCDIFVFVGKIMSSKASGGGKASVKKAKKRRRTSSGGRKKAATKNPKKTGKRKGRGGSKDLRKHSHRQYGSADVDDDDDDDDDDIIGDSVEFQDLTKEEWYQLTEEEKDDYRDFRRSHFQKRQVRRFIESVSGGRKIDEKVRISVASCAKMFVGEIVETARSFMDKDGIPGDVSIPPTYIRRAYGVLRKRSKVLFDNPSAGI